MWRDQAVRNHGEGTEHLRHPRGAGVIELEDSAFAVDACTDLSMVIYNPTTSADRDRIRMLVESGNEL